jgi:capsid protein
MAEGYSLISDVLTTLDKPTVPVLSKPVTNRENRQMLRARFDSQFTTPYNAEHWNTVDYASIDAQSSWMVRRTLRARCRHEYQENSILRGIVSTISNYIVGTGPTLQMQLPDQDGPAGLNHQIETLWSAWSKTVRLSRTLRMNCKAIYFNGEYVNLLRSNPMLDHPVKLDVFEVEADQLSSPLFGMYPANYPDQFFDGLVLDPYGRPMYYHILRQHPGALGAFVIMGYEFDRWPAKSVLHGFEHIRPGQQRGIPELLPCLPLSALLRRYSPAVVRAAETAANVNLTIETEGAAYQEGQTGASDFDYVPLQQGEAMVMPAGTHARQLQAEQPTAEFDPCTRALLWQLARCLDIPTWMAMMSAGEANMASAYVVGQPFIKMVQTKRGEIFEPDLDRVFAAFLREATLMARTGELSDFPLSLPDSIPHIWRWPRIGNHADPSRMATAQETRLMSGTSSIQIECAEDGHNWKDVQAQNAESLGLTLEEYRERLANKRLAAAGAAGPGATPGQKPARVPVPVVDEDETDADDDGEGGDD